MTNTQYIFYDFWMRYAHTTNFIWLLIWNFSEHCYFSSCHDLLNEISLKIVNFNYDTWLIELNISEYRVCSLWHNFLNDISVNIVNFHHDMTSWFFFNTGKITSFFIQNIGIQTFNSYFWKFTGEGVNFVC